MELENGFYTALGTPLDENGNIEEHSLRREIGNMIEAGARGLLLLGSMGMQISVVREECTRAAAIACDEVAGRVPLFVGVMDNSIRAVVERIEAMKSLPVFGVVLTPVYYFGMTPQGMRYFFTRVADASPFPLFLYDLPGATKIKLSYAVVAELQKHPNILGIKTADLNMILGLRQDPGVKKDFLTLYSGLDTVDVGAGNGVMRHLDGMFSCTPRNAREMEKCFAEGNIPGGKAHLNRILELRDLMISLDGQILMAYTVAMNLLGMPGCFAPDYEHPVDEKAKELIRAKLIEIGEL